jgi:hypothetical protein
MAWTSPYTFVAATILTAAQLNTQVRDNVTAVWSGEQSLSSQVAGDWMQASSGTAWVRKQPFIPYLSLNTTAVGNIGTGEDNLMSHALPPGFLSTDGWGIAWVAYFIYADNTANKTVKVKFGSNTILTLGPSAYQNFVIRTSGTVIRTGDATQLAMNEVVGGEGLGGSHSAYFSTPTQTLSSAITLQCTGTATSDGDIMQVQLGVHLIHMP